MRTLTYYVASTLDGFIAGPDGSFDFFVFEGDHMDDINRRYPETIPGHFRAPLGIDAPNATFDTVVMGRATYEVGLKEGIASPYPHLRQVVCSRSLPESPDPAVEVTAGDPVARVRELKREDGLGIWLCGGGRLAATLADEIDRLVVKLHPVAIGAGIPLFDGAVAPRRLVLEDTRVYDSGVALLTYTRG